MTAHTQQPQFIDHRYPRGAVSRMASKWLLAYDGDPQDLNSLAIGMNGESAQRFLVDGRDWLSIRGDTVSVVA